MNVEFVDYSITGKTFEGVEEYLNTQNIPYIPRIDREDNSDIELHVTTDDIPSHNTFIKDLCLKGDLSNVDKYIIYLQ